MTKSVKNPLPLRTVENKIRKHEVPFLTEEVVDKRVKEKQVKVLRDLVTVNRESEPKVPLGNREGGKDNDL